MTREELLKELDNLVGKTDEFPAVKGCLFALSGAVIVKDEDNLLRHLCEYGRKVAESHKATNN